jgi:2,3-diketo-5-methylthio-1-phosphopentane phosphatase
MEGKKITIFSDFDGTITNSDVLDLMIENLYSRDKYLEMESKLINGTLGYEKYLYDMFSGITYDYEKINPNIVDDTFKDFYLWVVQNKIDFFVVSSGFKKLILHLLPYVKEVQVFANDIKTNESGTWDIVLFDNLNNKTINKNLVINSLKSNNKTIFIGDGLSDFTVMGNVDVLFAKKNSLLHKKCIKENCPHIVFENFSDIKKIILTL